MITIHPSLILRSPLKNNTANEHKKVGLSHRVIIRNPFTGGVYDAEAYTQVFVVIIKKVHSFVLAFSTTGLS
jgi:hypothetical protein